MFDVMNSSSLFFLLFAKNKDSKRLKHRSMNCFNPSLNSRLESAEVPFVY
jgi:hypothetical protein